MQTPKVGSIYRLGRRISGRDGSEPVSKVPVVHHRQPGTAFANRKEPFSLGGSNRSICHTADPASTGCRAKYADQV